MNAKILKNRLLEKIQIVFNFKGKDGEKGFKDILNDLQNIGLSPIGTKRAKIDNCYILCYFVRVKILPFTQDKTYKKINNKYSKILNEFTIQKYKDLDVDWSEYSEYEEREISQRHITELLKILLKHIDTAYLETLLSNIILNSKNQILKDAELEAFGLTDNLEIFKKLFGNEKELSNKDIKHIFQLIDTNDFILLKHLFHLILQKCNYNPKELYDEYHKTIGKVPFSLNRLKYLYTTEIAHELCVLELFFKEYILLEKIIQEVNEKAKSDLEDIKIQIPFDIKVYRLEKKYPKRIIKIIKALFSGKRELIIPIFRMVLYNELLRLNIKFRGILVNFSYDDSAESLNKLREDGYYFDNLKTLYDDKLEPFRRATKEGVINEFVFFRCKHITQRNEINFDWSKEFKVRDINHRNIRCKITHNRTYFNELPLDMESEIEIQAILKVKYVYIKKFKSREIDDKYLEIIDIKIIDNFKVIKFHLGTHFNGDKWLENTQEGLSLFIYPTQKTKITPPIYQTKILNCPLILLNPYEGQNETFYEVKVNGEVICKPKKQLIEYLEEKNLVIDDGLIKKAISNILRESIKEYGLQLKPMFNTVGIFLKDNDFILVYENNENQRIIGENDVQRDLIDKINEKELDKEGKLTEIFYKIIHFPTLPENVRLSILGYSAISPFFYAFSSRLDLLPNLFLIGKHGTGKTTTLRIFTNLLFGTKMMKADDIRTEARLTKFLTFCLFILNIDDVDYLSEENIGMIKTYSTERGTRNRMDNQKMNKEQMYASIVGSANSKDFLTQHDDNAFRLRCIVHDLKINIESNTENKILLREFRKLHQQLKSSDKLFGYYLLKKAFEMVDKSNKGDFSTYKKMLKHFNLIYNQIEDYINNNEKINLSDIRRITLYSLIYIGWEIWDYTFKSKGFESPLLKEALNLNSETFFNYINDLEKTELNLRLGVIDNILQFFTSYFGIYSNKRTLNKKPEWNNLIVLQTDFINNYDKWAKPRGYNILKSLTRLGEIQSEILNKDVSPTTIIFQKDETTYRQYGLIFYYKELLSLRNDGSLSKTEIDEFINDKHVYGKIGLDKIMTLGVDKQLNAAKEKLIEIFETNETEILKITDVIPVLEVTLEYKKAEILKTINLLIETGFLIKIDEDTIKIVEL